MDSLMADVTNDEGLSPASSHRFDPPWSFSAPFFKICELSDMVGSGAVVPCGDRPSPALRTVRAACHRTRLALYALLE